MRKRTGRLQRFAAIPNDTIDDAANLDLTALGLLAVLIRHRDGWEITLADIGARYGYGEDALARAMGLLQVARYVVKVRIMSTRGNRWSTDVVVYDTPATDDEIDALLSEISEEDGVRSVQLIQPTKTALTSAAKRREKLSPDSGFSRSRGDLGKRGVSAGRPDSGVSRDSGDPRVSKKTVSKKTKTSSSSPLMDVRQSQPSRQEEEAISDPNPNPGTEEVAAPVRPPHNVDLLGGVSAGHTDDWKPVRRSDLGEREFSQVAPTTGKPTVGISGVNKKTEKKTKKTSSSSPLMDVRQSQPSHDQEEEEAATRKGNPAQAAEGTVSPPAPTPTVPQPRPGDHDGDGEHQAAAGLVSSLPGTLTRGNRNRLVSLTAAALTAGWTAGQLRAELMRDLGTAASPVGVWVTRLRELGDPPAAAPARAALPPRCDHPDHDQYGTDRLLYPANGPARPCPTCHPMYLGDAR